jgi:exodeoxyribonuclease VII large subunit
MKDSDNEPFHGLFDAQAPMSVGLLNRHVRQWLEQGFESALWVSGEVASLSKAPSGHVYFTLKDMQAQVRCTLWKDRVRRIRRLPAVGQHVHVLARIGFYEARGEYQLTIEDLLEAGEGRLFAEFMALKARLEAEGLFDSARKRPIPPFPKGIGVVSSLSAAGLADTLAAFARRAPGLPITIYPAAVQGASAPDQLIRALEEAHARQRADDVDVLLLVRGGGSPEDLHAFNHESLARAIARSALPIISGVGHETDFTIADFVADLRAATPTAAAEQASAGYYAASGRLEVLQTRLHHAQARILQERNQRVDQAAFRLSDPVSPIRQHRQALAWKQTRLTHAFEGFLSAQAQRLEQQENRLHHCAPPHRERKDRLAQLQHRLERAMGIQYGQGHARLAQLREALEMLNPEAVLARGYAIVCAKHANTWPEEGVPAPGTHLRIQLQRIQMDVAVIKAEARTFGTSPP